MSSVNQNPNSINKPKFYLTMDQVLGGSIKPVKNQFPIKINIIQNPSDKGKVSNPSGLNFVKDEEEEDEEEDDYGYREDDDVQEAIFKNSVERFRSLSIFEI
jgi:hypothetical protein